jgi:uncharacterized protein YabE (DUF348 family)
MRVLLTLSLAAASIGYLMAEKRVTLADDGHTKTVTTFAPTVGAALERLGVKLSPGDRIWPSPRAALRPNRHIEVRRAKDVIVVLNGARRVERVTGLTVAQVLTELSVGQKGARLEPSPASAVTDGEEIVVTTPAAVTVVHDNVSQPVVTNVMTTGALLRQLGLVLGPYDRVEPNIVAYPSSGSTVKVVRVNEAVEKVLSPIPFKRVTQKSATLELGLTKVATAGAEGVRAKTYRVTYEDGKPMRRILIGTQVQSAPQNEVTLIGNYRPPFVSHGGLQTGLATWYGIPGLTAAHRTLPFGTVVKVTNLANGRTITVVIRDRGPFGDGRIIDLSPTAFSQISSLGSGVLNVKIEW